MQGPVCPGPVRLDTPCPDRPIQARIDVRDGSGTSVVEVQTDAQGGFHAVLPAGSYTLVPRTPGGITHAPEQTVVVQPGQFTHVVVTYDTGMR